MSIAIKLTNDKGLILEKKSFVLVCFPKDNGDPYVVPIKLKEGISIPEETSTPQEIWICYEEDCDIVSPKKGEFLSDYLKKAFDSTKEAVESLTDGGCWKIYYIYYPLYETEKEVVWLGVRYEAKKAKFQSTRNLPKP